MRHARGELCIDVGTNLFELRKRESYRFSKVRASQIHRIVRIPDDADQRSGMMPITIPF